MRALHQTCIVPRQLFFWDPAPAGTVLAGSRQAAPLGVGKIMPAKGGTRKILIFHPLAFTKLTFRKNMRLA
jgi:hypothetical protein